ncbi:hypothetical protein SAMN05661080_01649 [Modestobacter sp. DSM 44400]|uniref:hypothetical protein n=1 Tax=Modestobacter sp. DSM 44400 TaxID=1550230 RepID=UPI00089820E3|nr:hypothetical protein [Modestobacter sp. DSM 44400]SDX90541.1 hypothetical protein SAMN05661080_01649 [Modestobacter sp. DSM 44400]
MFETSTFVPVVLGFFGLGTGYLIWGPQELFNFPARDPSVDRSLGVWGIFLPGLCQVVTGILLFVGMTWFQVFDDPALFMAALAFSAYGIHWFALGWNRYRENDPRPNAGMSVAFTVISVLGAFVFFDAGVWAVGVLFVGLTAVYVADFFVAVGKEAFERVLGLAHVLTGLWLMYLMVGTTLNIASGFTLPAG